MARSRAVERHKDQHRAAMRRERTDRLNESNARLADAKVLTYTREGGVCGRCGQARADECQHRLARGMGGASRDTEVHSPGAMAWLCRSCHAYVERHERAIGTQEGWVVRRGVRRPSEIPLLYRGRWVLLHDDGSIESVPDPGLQSVSDQDTSDSV